MFFKKDKKLNRGLARTLTFKKKGKLVCGFTIIETMISISVFLVIVTIGMDSLLNANMIHQKSKDQRSIMDNLNFIMEDMSRNIRTGYDFKCIQGEVAISDLNNTAKSCSGITPGGVIVFENALGDSLNNKDQWIYEFKQIGTTGFFNILKSTSNDGSVIDFTQLNPDEIKFSSPSSFYITGATAGENQQPLVTIRLVGIITSKGKTTSFSIQDTVSQRVMKK